MLLSLRYTNVPGCRAPAVPAWQENTPTRSATTLTRCLALAQTTADPSGLPPIMHQRQPMDNQCPAPWHSCLLPRAALAARQMQPNSACALAQLPALTPWADPTMRHRLPKSPVLARWRRCNPHTRDHPGLPRPCAMGQPCMGI